MQTNTVKKHKKRKKLSFPQQNWMKLSESLSFDVYNMHAKAGKWVFRAPEFILKRGVRRRNQIVGVLDPVGCGGVASCGQHWLGEIS